MRGAKVDPPHPAFATFRRMSYVWVDGQAFEPIGDSLDLWLTFLRGNGARQAWLDVSGGDEVCRVIRALTALPRSRSRAVGDSHSVKTRCGIIGATGRQENQENSRTRVGVSDRRALRILTWPLRAM